VLGWFLNSEVTFPREKPAADQISTHTWGQIGTTQLFNVLLDILLADQHMHTARDLTDCLPSCMPRLQQERAGEQECTRRIKRTLDHHCGEKLASSNITSLVKKFSDSLSISSDTTSWS